MLPSRGPALGWNCRGQTRRRARAFPFPLKVLARPCFRGGTTLVSTTLLEREKNIEIRGTIGRIPPGIPELWAALLQKWLAGQVDDDQEADLNKRLSNVISMRVECATKYVTENAGVAASSSSNKVRRARRRNKAAPGDFSLHSMCAPVKRPAMMGAPAFPFARTGGVEWWLSRLVSEDSWVSTHQTRACPALPGML